MVASFHLKVGRAGGATYTVAILRLLRPSAGGDWQNELTIVLVWDMCPSYRIMYEHLNKPITQLWLTGRHTFEPRATRHT